jgi:hypothetical protein
MESVASNTVAWRAQEGLGAHDKEILKEAKMKVGNWLSR